MKRNFPIIFPSYLLFIARTFLLSRNSRVREIGEGLMLLHKNNIIVYKHHKTFLSVGFSTFVAECMAKRDMIYCLYQFIILIYGVYVYMHTYGYGCNQKLCTIKEWYSLFYITGVGKHSDFFAAEIYFLSIRSKRNFPTNVTL